MNAQQLIDKYERLAETAHRMGVYKCAREWSLKVEKLQSAVSTLQEIEENTMKDFYQAKPINFLGFDAVKLFPMSGIYPSGGLHKNEARQILIDKGFAPTDDEPYFANANEEFGNLKPLEAVQAFVFFLN
jgi:hypothetical protein